MKDPWYKEAKMSYDAVDTEAMKSILLKRNGKEPSDAELSTHVESSSVLEIGNDIHFGDVIVHDDYAYSFKGYCKH